MISNRFACKWDLCVSAVLYDLHPLGTTDNILFSCVMLGMARELR